MKKFFVLVKKELKELLTPQMLIPFLVMMLAFLFIGKIMGKEAEKQVKELKISILDQDQTATSKLITDSLKESGFSVTIYSEEKQEEILSKVKAEKQKLLLVIPEGLEQSILSSAPIKIDVYSNIQGFSFMATRDIQTLSSTLTSINELVSSKLISEKISTVSPEALKHPIVINDYVIVADKQANINPSIVLNFITSQTTFIPIVLFLVITLASQLVATAIATEKENKTLETLLSSPINRKAIVAAKLLAAGLVSLLMAVLYLFGMREYVSGITGGEAAAAVDSLVKPALEELGLTFGTTDYLLLGLSLFSSILAALSLAFILGSFASDTKSAQGVITPLMVALLLPYLLTMFVDINTLSGLLKIAIYAIPFTHTFIAAPNILLDKYASVMYGNIYLLTLFAVSVYIASKLFTTEKILTMKLSFGKKK